MKNDPIKWGVFADKYVGIPDVLTRVEFQLRRNALKEFAVGTDDRIDGVDSYLKVRDNLWRYLTTEWFRLTDEPVDRKNNHQSRAKTWPVWESVQKAVGLVVDAVRRVKKKISVDCEHILKMSIGCMAKAAILEAGYSIQSPGDVVRHFVKRIQDYGARYVGEVMERHKTELYLHVGTMLEGV